MDLSDNFDLRFRAPKIHAMSFDADVAYLAAIPHENHPIHVLDEGALIVGRDNDPEFYRKIFLQLYEENLFEKTTVAEFLALKRSIIFEGTQLGPNWYTVYRGKSKEADANKISMLIPGKWAEEARAVQNFNDRMHRISERIQKFQINLFA